MTSELSHVVDCYAVLSILMLLAISDLIKHLQLTVLFVKGDMFFCASLALPSLNAFSFICLLDHAVTVRIPCAFGTIYTEL